MNVGKLFWAGCGITGLVIILLISIHCSNNGKRPALTNGGSDTLYFDYKLWGDEESKMITLNLQYRLEGSEGDAVKLKEPGFVKLDDRLIKPDSSRMNGVYYELNIPVQDFEGHHTITYINAGGQEFKEDFEFPVISLKTELPTTLSRSDLHFALAGMDTLDAIRIIVTDTSFYGRGIDRFDTVRNGLVTISKSELNNLRNGPIYLEFYKEEEWPLKETQSPGGRFSLSFAVKRVFELRDSIY